MRLRCSIPHRFLKHALSDRRCLRHQHVAVVVVGRADAAVVAAMEDILEVCQRPYDPHRPLVCLDETSKQLTAETRVPIAAKPSSAALKTTQVGWPRSAVGHEYSFACPKLNACFCLGKATFVGIDSHGRIGP